VEQHALIVNLVILLLILVMLVIVNVLCVQVPLTMYVNNVLLVTS
jgi:hypothetical protein